MGKALFCFANSGQEAGGGGQVRVSCSSSPVVQGFATHSASQAKRDDLEVGDKQLE